MGSQPTATATWTVAVPTDGEYAVYVWYRHGDNRASDARYTVYHAGGQTVVGALSTPTTIVTVVPGGTRSPPPGS